MLYESLEVVGERSLGFNSDSVGFVEKDGENLLETGDSLGELTDTFSGGWMTDWAGTGPKSYSYKTNSGKVTCKVKRFTLNHKNSKLINL